MNEDSVVHADQTVKNLQPAGIQTPLLPEDFHPGESWATWYGRKCDDATRQLRAVEEDNRNLAEENHQLKENQRQMVERRRQRGHSDEEIAEDLGCSFEELQQRYPRTR